ncbi:hypothetical protein DJ030_13755 [bacterium endosymbiont of Escarpia laminata]|nr:MAG: hypothetical protein DJ030_13755 [bacterium endosymbiont of Escarpia laminata]
MRHFLGVTDLNGKNHSSHTVDFNSFGAKHVYGPVFPQVTDHLSLHTFRRGVQRYQGERYVKRFRCFDQYLSMAFAQLTYRESLRDIEACLQAHQKTSFITCASVPGSYAVRFPMPTSNATDASMPTLPKP